MVELFFAKMNSPIGGIKITTSAEHLLGVEFCDSQVEGHSNKIVEDTLYQLAEYFAGVRRVFDLPIRLEGSDFQIKAWQALYEIPYGETVSYKEQAAMLGNPNSVRAVGGANNKNKIAIIVPCHRVVGAKGDLVGYASGVDKKNWLIQHEKRIKNEKL